jgi:hypothetical protein
MKYKKKHAHDALRDHFMIERVRGKLKIMEGIGDHVSNGTRKQSIIQSHTKRSSSLGVGTGFAVFAISTCSASRPRLGFEALVPRACAVFNLLSAASAAAARGSEGGVAVVPSFDWAAVLPNI